MANCPVCLTRLPAARALTAFMYSSAKIRCPKCSATLQQRAGHMLAYHVIVVGIAVALGALMAITDSPLHLSAGVLATWMAIAALWFVAIAKFAALTDNATDSRD